MEEERVLGLKLLGRRDFVSKAHKKHSTWFKKNSQEVVAFISPQVTWPR